MKKIICLFLFVALSQAIHAWIVETGANTKTFTVKVADMKCEKSFSASYLTMAHCFVYDSLLAVTSGTGTVNLATDMKISSKRNYRYTGFLVGAYIADGKRSSYDLCINASPANNRIVTKVKIDYVIEDEKGEFSDIHPATKGHLGRTTYEIVGYCDDIAEGTATIEPYLPISIIPIVCESNNLYSDENMPAGACLVTKITVEYVESTFEHPVNDQLANRTTDYYTSLSEEIKTVTQNDDRLSRRTTLLSRKNKILNSYYAKAVASDVNADGNVNSADVTSVYNAILSGDGEVSGIRYVDLGLPSGKLWAAMNYGAVAPEDFGDFYAFSHTAGFLSHNIVSFSSKTYSDYPEYNVPDPWRIPTEADALELINNCTSEKTYINDVYCMVLTSNINGNQLILPATAGEVNENGYNPDAYYAQYWTSTQRPSDRHMRKTLEITPYSIDYDIDTDNSMYYYEGCYLRLVCPKQK